MSPEATADFMTPVAKIGRKLSTIYIEESPAKLRKETVTANSVYDFDPKDHPL
jgi:hypothetical protein